MKKRLFLGIIDKNTRSKLSINQSINKRTIYRHLQPCKAAKHLSFSALEKLALKSINAVSVNALNKQAFDNALQALINTYGYKLTTTKKHTMVKAFSPSQVWEYDEKKQTVISTKQAIKPISLSELSKAFNMPVNKLIDNTMPCNDSITAFLHYAFDKRLGFSFLESLEKKGNSTALDLIKGKNALFNRDDIFSIVKEYAFQNVDGFSIDKDGNAEFFTDYTPFYDNESLDCTGFILGLFKVLSRTMYSYNTRSLLKCESMDNSIKQAHNSIDLDVLGNVETIIDIKGIIKEIEKSGKTASDIRTLFIKRLQGYSIQEISDITGIKKDRLTYCNKLLMDIGKKLGYNICRYHYTSAQLQARKYQKKLALMD